RLPLVVGAAFVSTGPAAPPPPHRRGRTGARHGIGPWLRALASRPAGTAGAQGQCGRSADRAPVGHGRGRARPFHRGRRTPVLLVGSTHPQRAEGTPHLDHRTHGTSP